MMLSLDERIKLLEGVLQNTTSTPTPTPPTPQVLVRNGSSTSQVISSSGEDAAASDIDGTTSTGSNSTSQGWLDNSFLAAKTFSIGRLNDQAYVNDSSDMSQAMIALDGALSEFGILSEAPTNNSTTHQVSKDAGQRAIQVAFESLKGEFFTSLLDQDLIQSVGGIISSPHIQIDPAVRLVYYNLLFHGHLVGGFETQTTARASYLQCLRFLEEWQDTATGTTMDLVAACLSMWSAVQNFDYDLAWEMHSLTCQFVKSLNIHLLDHPDSPVQEGCNEEFQDKQREGFWVTLVVVDLFFQLCLDRPSCISAEASPENVHLPSLGDPTSERPLAKTYSTYFVWIRVIFIAKDFFEEAARQNGKPSQAFHDRVDAWCDEIMIMITDWRLAEKMILHTDDPIQSHIYNDCLVASLTVLLQMDKLRQPPGSNSVSDLSVRASRKLLDAIVRFDEDVSAKMRHEGLSMYSIAFWSFRAFFALYYHILSHDSPDDHQNDIGLLDRLAACLNRAAHTRFEYGPIAKAVISLNEFARNFQRARSTSPARQLGVNYSPQQIGVANLSLGGMEERALGHGGSEWDSMQFFQNWNPYFADNQNKSPLLDIQEMTSQPAFEPVTYVQAVERQFAGSLWNYGWWDENFQTPLQ